MKIAVCDIRISKSAVKALESHADRVLLLPPFTSLSEPVSSHPDMLMFPFENENMILTHAQYADKLKTVIGSYDLQIVPIPEIAGDKYPNDIMLNAVIFGKHLFGRLPYLSSSLISLADKSGFIKHDVRQGYTKCSVCKVSDNAMITSDPSIASVADSVGIDVLIISDGGVELPPYSHGFIGGASGSDGENVFFCGDIKTHQNGKEITDFCIKHKKKPVSLSQDRLYDVGTIFFLDV
ncbi:MAG: hypothetical protein U0M06_02515 [Clostridia bacterium]|nr:hypothetical protein [Clostridia bacterium]